MDMLHWVYPFIVYHLSFEMLPLSGCYNNASTNVHVQDSVWAMLPFFLGIYLGVELLGPVVTLCYIPFLSVDTSCSVFG